MREAKLEELDDFQRHVVLVSDEMRMKVYDMNHGEVIGFVKMGGDEFSGFDTSPE